MCLLLEDCSLFVSQTPQTINVRAPKEIHDSLLVNLNKSYGRAVPRFKSLKKGMRQKLSSVFSCRSRAIRKTQGTNKIDADVKHLLKSH